MRLYIYCQKDKNNFFDIVLLSQDPSAEHDPAFASLFRSMESAMRVCGLNLHYTD